MPKYMIEYHRVEQRCFIVEANNPQEALNAWDEASSDDARDEFQQHIRCEFVAMHHDEEAGQ